MTENKRFTTNGYYIYDHFKEYKWLVNEVEAQEIVDIMNNLDTKARENSKALSTLQKKYNALHEENYKIKSLLLKKVDELNDDYDKSARAGMPTGAIIGELDSFEEVCRFMGWIE